MLESVKIQGRQSAIREELAKLIAKESPTEEETRLLGDLEGEYQTNETRYRAALVAEDVERTQAADDIAASAETRERSEMLDGFEVRQVARALGEDGATLDGATGETVAELRSEGSYQGIPVPYEALGDMERRVATTASGVPDPVMTHSPPIDRLFPMSVASKMGAAMVRIPMGLTEYPVVTSGQEANWQATEGGDLAAPVRYITTDRPLRPDHTLGVRITVTRRSLKQSGGMAIEAAIRRDMAGAIAQEMDKAVFGGTGVAGQPLGFIHGASSYGINTTAFDASANYSALRAAITRMLVANAASSPADVRVLLRPEVFDTLDGDYVSTSSSVTEWERLTNAVSAMNICLSSNALPVPDGAASGATTAALTVDTGGVPCAYVGLWGAVDMIRDPFSDAASGGLRLTALSTMDVTVARPAQIEVLTGLQTAD